MSNKDYRITPPPKETGDQPLFRVVHEIDVNAVNERKAAENAWQMVRSADALDPVLTVLDSEGKKTKLDLSEYLEFKKVTTGFVVQTYRKTSKDKFRCIDQEFVASDDVQFENTKGQPIEVPIHEYQPFNITLLSTSQIINRLEKLLTSINVGGEQSRQFAYEIKMLNKLLKGLGWSKDN